jgi:uncharacterized NAD(P)/FAD-binding protein YdhS
MDGIARASAPDHHDSAAGYSVALVGAGPTGIYSLQALLDCKHPPASITVYERQRHAGQGTPYSANWSDPIMLANIASIEIPALPETLSGWLEGLEDARLAALGVDRADINERAFFPRLVLGEYLSAQFSALLDRARRLGVRTAVLTQSDVVDVSIVGAKIELTVTNSRKTRRQDSYDYVILATGHQWPPDPEIRPGYFTSPWPASALERIRNCAVGIRGSSLTAIDAAVALANHHGEFVQHGDQNRLAYLPAPRTEHFSVTMLSRKGLLPEADFFHPIPYEPLAICNAEAIERLIASTASDGLLDGAFELFRAEMLRADSAYATALGLQTLSLEEFCKAYFHERETSDPYEWARDNLEEARANLAREYTVPWRYAILRMHEVIGLLAVHLSDSEFVRFSETLKPVFVDNYATVPHASVERLLALRTAGKFAVEKLDAGFRLDTHREEPGALLRNGKEGVHFRAFIEATGQSVLGASDFPFPSLLRQGVVQDVVSDESTDVKRGIAIDGQYHPISSFVSSDRLFCLSLPFLLGQHPFAQGITSSAEMASVVADAIQVAQSALDGRRSCESFNALAVE